MRGKSKKILILSIISLIIILASIFTITKVTNNPKNIDAEILRSMNYAEVTDEGKVENTDFVKFSAFFTRDLDGDENAEKLLGTCRNVNNTDQLYIDLNVLTNGYLTNGKITINSTNFNYSMNMVKDSVLKNNYISNNVKVIELNQVNSGTQKLILGDIHAYIGNDINNYSKTSTITLTGTHISDEGIETNINKTVEITVDWHGEVKAELRGATAYYNYDELDTETVSVSFTLNEIQKELILKDNEVKVTIPELNGFAPTEVKCTNSNIESEYNSESKELKIKRTSTYNDNGIVTSTLSRSNTYTVQITYPKEAYDAISSYTTLTINAEGYYTGYNNPNEEFKNPYESNKVKGKATIVFREKPKGSIYNFYVDFVDKKYVSDPLYRYVISKQYLLNLYDNYNIDIENTELEQENKTKIENKEYVVRWQAVRGPEGVVPSMIMSETKVNTVTDIPYGDKWDSTVMEEYVTNSGIYFEGVDNMLEDDGTISVYNNDTNELIHTFTKEEWNNYSRNNPYKYENSIKHIRVETSKTKLNATLSVYNVKELELERVLKDFTKEQIKDLDMGYTYLTGICNIEGQNAGIANRIDSVKFISEKSNSKISIQTQKIPTQEILNNQKIYIDTIYNEDVIAKWQNGEFLIEIPKEIINMNIKNISVSDSKVKISVYDLYKKDDRYFIKIITENEEPITSYRITIDCTMTPDPRVASSNKTIRLYDHNKYCNEYYNEIRDVYDVDSDNNTSELVGTASTSINLLSPTSLITLETITNYDDKKDDEITIAPNIAELTKETKEATINVSLTNNYPNTVSGVQILGKIPFEGNTYILNPNELGSEFTTTMKEQGIKIPEELKEKAVVYYSENENPDKNLDNNKNGWTLKENVQDFSKVKTYLIDLAQYTINVGTTYTFNYTINIQDKTDYNLASYSDHAVYYEYDTEGGKLQLSTEPNKVGIRITRKYKLELTKTKENFKNLRVPGATYKIEYVDIDGTERTRILTTDYNGNINMDELYVGKTYKITEMKAPGNYVLNNETIEFTVVEDEQGNLKVETTSEGKITINEDEEKVLVKTEDEPRYNIIITKTDESTGEALTGVRFRINGSMYTTNRDGQITLKQLLQNEEYTVVEEEAEGYYLPKDSITFKLVKDENGDLQIESNSEAFNNATIQNTEEEDLIQVSNINITNEKIPTYNLQILKVEQNEKEQDITKLKPLHGARFQLRHEDLKREKDYYTDENGNLNIFNLYQYVEGKYITGNYTLQEVDAPLGYATNLEEIKFRVSKIEDKLDIKIEDKENKSSIRDVQIEDGTIKMIIQDVPLFTLIKTDSETGNPLDNAKFVIYEVNEKGEKVDFAKDAKGDYVGEIDEKNRYVLTTDETGKIVLPLRAGKYKAIEIEYPDGYLEKNNSTFFEIGGKKESSEEIANEDIIKINTIEDLVQLSNDVNNGNTYEGKTIKLMRTLNFEDDASYNNPYDKSYGDLNKNGVIEEIKLELTNKETGCGFTPIGTYEQEYSKDLVSKPFSGTFDGNGYEIQKIYINRKDKISTQYTGLFGFVKSGEIKKIGLVGGELRIPNSNNGMDGYVAGIAGRAENATISDCYNTSNIEAERMYPAAGIIGYAGGSNVRNCYNEGEVKGYIYAGGIIGYAGGTRIECCYNTGTIIAYQSKYTGYGSSDAGGIVCRGEGSNISDCYNIGEIYGEAYGPGTAGIAYSFKYGSIENCYNAGKMYIAPIGNTHGIVAEQEYVTVNNTWYTCDTYREELGSKISSDYLKTKEFYNTLNKNGVWTFMETSYPRLFIVKKTTNLNVQNTLKQYNITTEIGINSESSRTGGTITGNYNQDYSSSNNIKFVEAVKHGHDSTNKIDIVPKKDYIITNMTINGKNIEYEINEDGSYTIPEGYFKEVKEDKHIIVIFEKISDTFIINKVDSEDESKVLQGAKFKIEQLEDRPEVTNEVGALIENSEAYVIGIETTPVSDVLGTLTNNGTYYFNNVDGKYISNNNKGDSYNRTTANSYIPIDLTGKSTSESYTVVVNAQVSSEQNWDFGYATVTDNTTAPVHIKSNAPATQFMSISGTVPANDYKYILQGGSKYYLHLGYTKDSSSSSGDDKVTINSVNVYKNITETYNFIQSDGKYVSSNQGKGNTTANSYIPIDLTNTKGKYTLEVDAQISSQYGDYGYATVTKDTSRPAYNLASGRFIYISGTTSTKQYITLDAGYKYYLHLGYRKDGSGDSGNDVFTVNNVKLSLNTSDFYKKVLTTNKSGQIIEKIPFGKYRITEIEAPKGYTLLKESKEITLIPGNINITIGNKKTESFKITKVDKNTNNPIPNTKFVIYSLNEENKPVDFAKDYDNNYLGTEENGKYVLTTDENGQISVRPKPGIYKAVEIESADKYFFENGEYLRTIYFKVDNEGNYYDESDIQHETESGNTDLVINNIEDLVRFANTVNSGTSYEGKTIKLARALDFNDNDSYSNPNDTGFGDYNGDGTIEGIKEELTKESVTGFKSIGIDELKPFKGTFNGNGHEIRNIYIGYGYNRKKWWFIRIR